MKSFFKSRNIQKWKGIGKKGLSLILACALLAGYISWENIGVVSASEETLAMPNSSLFPKFNMMSAQMAEHPELYYQYDNAGQCFFTASGNVIEQKKNMTSFRLSTYEFKGRGATIGQSFSNNGSFSLTIKLRPYEGYMAEGDENYFTSYKRLKELKTRLVYQKSFVTYYQNYTTNISKEDSGTHMNDWNDMIIWGNALYWISNIMVVQADFVLPKNTSYEGKRQDDKSALWLSTGKNLRPSNTSITKSQLANMKLKVSLIPKYNQSEANKVIAYYEATDVDYVNGKICFTAVSEADLSKIEMSAADKAKVVSAEALNKNDWRVVSIEDASVEEEYQLQGNVVPSYGGRGKMKDTGLTVSAPITDIAGNPVELAEELNYETEKFYLELSLPTIEESSLTGSMIKTDVSAEIAQADKFAGIGENVSLSLTLSKKVSLTSGASLKDIYLTWEAKDGDANVVTRLKEIKTVNKSVNTDSVSMLVFEPITVTEQMSGTIAPKALVGAEKLVDSSGNVLNGSLEKAYPDRSVGIDTQGPSISVTGNVVQQADYQSGKDAKYYIIPIKITDGFDNTGADGAGLITSAEEDVTQYLSVTSESAPDNLRWQFAVTDNTEKVEFLSKRGNGVNADAAFTVHGAGDYFLHLYLTTTKAKAEIENTTKLNLNFKLYDAKGNVSNITNATTLTDLRLDNQAPTVVVTPQATTITRDSDTQNTVNFSAKIEASDINGLSQLAYQWTDVGVEATDNNWNTVSTGKTVSDSPVVEVSVGTIEKKLWVKAVDKIGNVTIYESDAGTFTANVIRVNAQYEITYDSNKPGGISDVTVLTPIATTGKTGGYTRATVTLSDGTTYVGVYNFTAGNLTERYSIFDTSKGSWYKVTMDSGKYSTVTEAAPDWTTYYNNLTIAFAASESDLTPVEKSTVTPDGTDTTFLEGSSFTMSYTSKNDDVHSIDELGVMGSTGESLSLTQNSAEGYANYYHVGTNLTGVRYNFTITNKILSELGSSDVDFTNSYAVFMKTDENGKNPTAVTDEIKLTEGSEQSIAVPYKEGGYGSGAYAFKIHLAQKSGGVQEFIIEDLLLVDNESIPEYVGVSEYRRDVQVGYITASDNHDILSLGKSVDIKKNEGITSIDVGNAVASTDTEVISIDGKPAFTTTTANGLAGSLLKITLRAEREAATKALGQTLGKVDGFRYWNQASSGEPSEIEWTTALRYDTYACDSISENVTLGSIYSILVDEKTLATTNVKDFRLVEGHNVVCYQLILENGKTSPVYTFDINLYDQLPEVEVSYEVGTSVTSTEYVHEERTYPIKNSAYERIYAESYAVKVEKAYSENGEITVYRATYKDSGTSNARWEYEKVDAGSAIPIQTSDTDGYKGIHGTRSERSGSVRYSKEVTEYYIFVDAVGNTRIFYPILTDKQSEAKAVQNWGWPVLEKDEYGVEWATAMEEGAIPTMYYFSKNTNVGTLSATSSYSTEKSAWEIAFGQGLQHNLEQISITIDDREEVMLDPMTSQTLGMNQAGIISFVRNTNTGGSKVYYEFPYDAKKAEGEMIAHKVTIKGYRDGELAKDINGKEAIVELEVTAANTKPALTKQGASAVGSVAVSSNVYLYAQGITDTETDDMFARDFALKLYKNGTYTQGFYDKYGAYYEFAVEVNDMPSDPVVTVSNTENTADPVEIKVESAQGALTLGEGTTLPEGLTVKGAGTSELTVVVTENVDFDIICTYDADNVVTIPMSITNIYNKPIDPVIVWDYNKYKVNPEDNSYEGEVTVSLIDKNGSPLTDSATGLVPSYTFVPGGEISYTFTNYVNIVGKVGADVTVTLPVKLKTVVTENQENDTYAPDVAITGYAKFKSSTITLDGVVAKTDANRSDNVTNYADIYGVTSAYDNIEDLMAKAALAEKFIFNLDIKDENMVKLFLAEDKYAAIPDYTTGASGTIAGVSIVGRTLQITENAEFALHIVDSKNNVTSFYFNVTNLSDTAPKPIVTQVLTKTGDEVRAYFTNPKLAGVSGLKITSAGAKTETDTTSDFYGAQYMSFEQNYPDGITVSYSYNYNNIKVEGSVILYITELDMTVPQEKERKWSANYDGTGVKYTNQDITAQLTFSKALSDVYLADKNGTRIPAPEGVSVTYLENRVTIVYEKNTEALYLKVVEATNKKHTNIITLPTISTIDKVGVVLSYQEELSSNHRKATITFNSNEAVSWPNGNKGRKYTVTTAENGSISVNVSDKAGNIKKLTVEITDIIEEDLNIALSYDVNGSKMIKPETDKVDIGKTIYIQTNRTSVVTLNEDENTKTTANAGSWTPLVITEDSEGLYPSIQAVDEYGNAAVVQLLQIPIKDRTKPSILLNKNLVSASLEATDAELEAILRSNYVASDNATTAENLVFSYELAPVTSAGKYMVTYKVTDEAGNTASVSGWIRFYDGQEICIKLNGEVVEREGTVLVSSGTQTITITHTGEPYKVEWRKGLKSSGQMKNNANVLTEYTEETDKKMAIELTESGYYTFLVTTQGRDTYRFVLYVEE